MLRPCIDLSLPKATLKGGDSMRRHRRVLRCLLVSLVMGALLIAWAGPPMALAASPVKPQGTVTVAFHSFSKEVMDPAQRVFNNMSCEPGAGP
jgi:hypothetical protein